MWPSLSFDLLNAYDFFGSLFIECEVKVQRKLVVDLSFPIPYLIENSKTAVDIACRDNDGGGSLG